MITFNGDADTVEGLRSMLVRVMDQAAVDLKSAHEVICKLQGLDPAKHDWPAWSPQANTLRWHDQIRKELGIASPSAASAGVTERATLVSVGIDTADMEPDGAEADWREQAIAAWDLVAHLQDQLKERMMTPAQIKYMVDRFLQWKLPEDFHPDGGISFEPVGSKGTEYEFRRQPVGTNLLTATQAEAMVRHILDGLPVAVAHIVPSSDWQPIETAPKTSANDMTAKPFIGWCPDLTAPNGGDQRVIWWEPKMNGGCWYGDRDIPEYPTLWKPLGPDPSSPAMPGDGVGEVKS